jgi:oligosaccharide repeat unit polymerase
MATNLLLIAVWAAAILLSRRLFRDVFTPLCCYVSIWSLCLLLFRFRLVNYYELETRTIVLIGGSIFAFVLGCVVACRRTDVRDEGWDLPRTLDQKSLEFIIKALCVFNLIGTLIFAYRMNNTYGLATYISDPAVIRRDFDEWTHVGGLGLLMMLDYPLLVCTWIHYLLTKKWRWFTVFAMPLVLVQTFLRTDRGSFTMYVITCISLWIYWNRWRSLNSRMLRKLGFVAILLVAYFLGLGLFYGKLVALQEDAFNAGDLSVTSQLGLLLVNPYIYATSPIGGFQPAMADVRRLSWGEHTFFPVARVLYSFGFLDDRPEPYDFDFYLVPIPVNTYTHLFAFYQDFGAAGVIWVPLALGYLETRLYLRMKARPSIFSLGASSAFTALNVFSVFVPLITSISFWYYSVVLYAISRICQFQKPVSEF